MKTPLIHILKRSDLLRLASRFKTSGKLAVTDNNLVYLDIDNNFVHTLYPHVQTAEILKPDYFKPNAAGAHVSVMYPEEKFILDEKALGEEHRFTLRDIITAEIGAKTYYAIAVESESLLRLRRKHQLNDLLNFKGYAIGFHITFGVALTSKDSQ